MLRTTADELISIAPVTARGRHGGWPQGADGRRQRIRESKQLWKALLLDGKTRRLTIVPQAGFGRGGPWLLDGDWPCPSDRPTQIPETALGLAWVASRSPREGISKYVR